jgi:hypothetical protein
MQSTVPMFVTRPRNALYFRTRGSWDVEYYEPFTYADGLVNAVTGGAWNSLANLLTISSNKAASPAAIANDKMIHTFAAWNCLKGYQLTARIQGSDQGGLFNIMAEDDGTAGSQTGFPYAVVQFVSAGGAIQIDLYEGLANRGTAAQAVVSPLIRGGVAGNNFGIEFALTLDVSASQGATRTARILINGTEVIRSSILGLSGNLNKRIALYMNYGPPQLFKCNDISLGYRL